MCLLPCLQEFNELEWLLLPSFAPRYFTSYYKAGYEPGKRLLMAITWQHAQATNNKGF